MLLFFSKEYYGLLFCILGFEEDVAEIAVWVVVLVTVVVTVLEEGVKNAPYIYIHTHLGVFSSLHSHRKCVWFGHWLPVKGLEYYYILVFIFLLFLFTFCCFKSICLYFFHTYIYIYICAHIDIDVEREREMCMNWEVGEGFMQGGMWGQADIDSLDTFCGLTSLMGSMHFEESNETLNKRWNLAAFGLTTWRAAGINETT